MSVDQVYNEVQSRMTKSIESFKGDLGTVRTGAASTSLVDNMMVDCYGSAMPINQLASVSAPEAQTLLIQPWDSAVLTDIEKAILKSDLGLNPSNDGKTIRITIPPLSEERRKELIKVVKKMAEDVKIAVRNIRREGNDKVKKLEKDKQISEDEQRKAEGVIQKKTDDFTKQIGELLEKKEQELLKI